MTESASISFSGLEAPREGTLAILAEEGARFAPLAREIDAASGGHLARGAEVAAYKGKKNAVLDLIAPPQTGLSRVLAIGAGKASELTAEDWVNLGGVARGALAGRDGKGASVALELDGGLSPDSIADFALGLMLRGYKFDKYKSKKKAEDSEEEDSPLKSINVLCADPEAARAAFSARKALAEGVIRARDLVNEPANMLGPAEFAARAEELSSSGVAVEVLGEEQLEKLGMGALLAIGQGSVRPSHVVVMRWSGASDKDARPIAFVGKGVTFDTGGISLKPSAGMEDMKGDMAGAACVVGLMHALAGRGAKVNAIGAIGLVENMPSGAAIRPGDVVTAMSGTTIEVLNTDAEGRMVLADVLWHVQQQFKPRAVINLATLTGAIMVALGKEHAGLFSNDDALAQQLTEAGLATDEKVWRMPLGKKYDKMIESKVADIKNTGGRWGGAISAAQFLQRFIEDGTPWAHIDIAGTGMAASDSDVNRSWGSGFGVRLLDRLVSDHYEDKG
jgi:leucyl aminopeptidase